MLGEGGSGISCSVSCANSQKNIGEGTDEKLLRSRRFLGPFLSNTWQNSPDHSPWTSGVSFSSLPSPPSFPKRSQINFKSINQFPQKRVNMDLDQDVGDRQLQNEHVKGE